MSLGIKITLVVAVDNLEHIVFLVKNTNKNILKNVSC